MNSIMGNSPWKNQIDIVIRTMARERARKLSPTSYDLQVFITTILVEALHDFHETYNSACDARIEHMEKLLRDYANSSLTPIVIPNLQQSNDK